MKRLTRRIILLGGALSLAGCSDWWFGESLKPPLPGERISVLSLERRREPDPAIAQLAVRLPRPVANPEWPEAGGYPNHAMQHLALPDEVKKAWTASVGSSSSRAGQLLATPVVFGGRLYSVDADSRVRAFDTRTGQRLWETDITPKEERGSAFGGGVPSGGPAVRHHRIWPGRGARPGHRQGDLAPERGGAAARRADRRRRPRLRGQRRKRSSTCCRPMTGGAVDP